MSFRNALFVTAILVLGSTQSWAKEEKEKDSAIRVSASDKAACLPDALRLCREAMPNVQDVLACFDRQREKISTGCRAVLVSYGLQ